MTESAETETDGTKTDSVTATEQTRRQKQQSSVLPTKLESARTAAETHHRLLHSESCALIPLHTMGTCQHSHASLAPVPSKSLCQQV